MNNVCTNIMRLHQKKLLPYGGSSKPSTAQHPACPYRPQIRHTLMICSGSFRITGLTSRLGKSILAHSHVPYTSLLLARCKPDGYST